MQNRISGEIENCILGPVNFSIQFFEFDFPYMCYTCGSLFKSKFWMNGILVPLKKRKKRPTKILFCLLILVYLFILGEVRTTKSKFLFASCWQNANETIQLYSIVSSFVWFFFTQLIYSLTDKKKLQVFSYCGIIIYVFRVPCHFQFWILNTPTCYKRVCWAFSLILFDFRTFTIPFLNKLYYNIAFWIKTCLVVFEWIVSF